MEGLVFPIAFYRDPEDPNTLVEMKVIRHMDPNPDLFDHVFAVGSDNKIGEEIGLIREDYKMQWHVLSKYVPAASNTPQPSMQQACRFIDEWMQKGSA